MSRPLRVVLQGPLPGARNMAVDEALAVAGDPAFVASLRFYGWTPWAISLGHHQSPEILDRPAIQAQGFDVVRRPTGGMAVLHAEELTVSLAGPDLRAWGLRLSDTVAIMARSIADVLAAGGVDGLAGPGRPLPGRKDPGGGSACFSGGGRHEVWVGGRKIAGLAARRWGRAFLVHGSFLLGPAHLALPGCLRLSGVERDALRASLQAGTACLAELGAWDGSDPPGLADGIAARIAASAECERASGGLGAVEEEAALLIQRRDAGSALQPR